MHRPLWQGPRRDGRRTAGRARQVIRSWWPQHDHRRSKAGEILDGFAWYLQGRAIERVFDQRYLRPGHSVEARPYLGDHVIWSFPPLRLSRHAVVARDRHGAVFDGTRAMAWHADPSGRDVSSRAICQAIALTANAIVDTISNAAGQDLSWAFDAAASGVQMNYSVTGLSSTDGSNCAAPCVDTIVTVARDGNGMFTGRAAQRSRRIRCRRRDRAQGDASLTEPNRWFDGTDAMGRVLSGFAVRRGPLPRISIRDRRVALDRQSPRQRPRHAGADQRARAQMGGALDGLAATHDVVLRIPGLMCGIAGLVDFDGAHAPESLVRAMCAAMSHRGPDDEGRDGDSAAGRAA